MTSRAPLWIIVGLLVVGIAFVVLTVVDNQREHDRCVESNSDTLLSSDPGDSPTLRDCG